MNKAFVVVVVFYGGGGVNIAQKFSYGISTIYVQMYMLEKMYKLFIETGRKWESLPARANTFYFYQHYVYIVLIL